MARIKGTNIVWDTLYLRGALATCSADVAGAYGAIPRGALAVADGKIAWVGPEADLPAPADRLALEVVDLHGGWLTPGLIDSHTHLVFGGNRAVEFERRLTGVSYEQIAREGGGINSTVRATRETDEGELLAAALPRARNLVDEGVTTIEVKSGYGLSLEHELKQLRVARALEEHLPVSIRTTFLGAHSVPAERTGDRDAYIDDVIAMLPEVKRLRLADAVDAFCETIGFSPEQTERVFIAARELGLRVKLHADQLSDLGGAALAARYNALSADHLEYTSEAGVVAMKEAGTVAVLLPGAFYVLRETQLPPLDALRAHGVPIAIATDLNPGSAPVHSLLLTINMACTLFRMTPEEGLLGVTRHAARALGLTDRGTLEVGKRADLAHFNIDHPSELAYRIGFNPLSFSVSSGRRIARRSDDRGQRGTSP